MTEKYAVEIDTEKVKVAESLAAGVKPAACPKCGSNDVDYAPNVPVCPVCGTEPFEVR